MDNRSLQVFLRVAANLSFSRTAEELHMSVSAVSRAIARLEDALGQPLFERDRRTMRPTSAARRLQPYAERVTAEWRALQQGLHDDSTLSGELGIYCSVTASHRLLSPLLQAYRAACPGVDVRLQTGDAADGIERVRRGDADVAMVLRPFTLSAALSFQPVASTAPVLCAPPVSSTTGTDYMQQSERDFLPALAHEPWILPDRGVTRDVTEAWLRDTLPSLPPVYARVAGHEAIVAMVALGLGVGIVPRLVVEAGAFREELALRRLPGLPMLEIGLCARSGRLADPLVARFLACIDTGGSGGDA